MGPKMNFSEIVELFHEFEKTSQRTLLAEELAKFIKTTEADDLKTALYLIQGTIFPLKSDKVLGVAEKMLKEAVAKQSGYSEEEVSTKLAELGDLGLVIEELLNSPQQSTLFESPKILDIHRLIDNLRKIPDIQGDGSNAKKLKVIRGLLTRCTPNEAKYLVKIILGNLRLGVSVHTILDAFVSVFAKTARDQALIERMYMFNADIGEIGFILKTKGVSDEVELVPVYHQPIKPMLASRVDHDKILKKHGGSTYAEWKLDGERVQIHKMKDTIVLFSRGLNDITEQYPDVVKYLKEAIGTFNAVVEGEIVGYKDGKFLPFQQLMGRKRKTGIEQAVKDIPVRVYLFDILKHSDKDHTNTPYYLRRDILAELFQDTDNVFLVPQKECHTTGQLIEFFNEAQAKGLEGIIAKKKIGKYDAGKRGDNWIKLKAIEGGKMDDTIDVVIIGGNQGRGRRATMAGSFLCAILDEDKKQFIAFTNIGTGFSDEQIAELTNLANEYTIEMPPPNVFSYVAPDIWVAPQIVIEIMVDEIQYRQGKAYSPRFPVFKQIRNDKGPSQITTLKEIKEMYARQQK